MTKQRKQYDTGFKLEVVRMIHEQGLSARMSARASLVQDRLI